MDMTILHDDAFDKAAVVRPLYRKLEKRLAVAGAAWTASELFKVKCYAQDARDYFKDILLQSLSTSQDYLIDPTCYPPITQLYPEFTQELGDPFLDICTLPGPSEDDHSTLTLDLDSLEQEGSHSAIGLGLSVAHSSTTHTLDDETPAAQDTLESVEKLACLILFSEHIIAFCDSRWEKVDTSGAELAELLNTTLEEDVREEVDDNPESIDQLQYPYINLEIPDEPLMTPLDLEPLFEEKLTLKQSVSSAVFTGRDRVNVMDVDEVVAVVGVAQKKGAKVVKSIAI